MEKQSSQDSRHFERQEHPQGRDYGRVRQVQEREQHDHERVTHLREHVKQAGQQAERHGQQHQQAQSHTNDIAIFIDHKVYRVKNPRITAADVRKISVPPIRDDEDVFHVVAGAGRVKMSESEVVEIDTHQKEHGRHFFSAPKSESNSSRHDEVARKAYAIYLQRGCKHGRDREDWLEAEAETKKGQGAE